jgi:type I restriction-modification system DNA methylase subunit
MSTITEWEFTADVASIISEILRDRPDLPFASAHCEQRGKGSAKRRDITLRDRSNKPALTGEVKMPDKRDGRSPIQEAVVIDAHNKANAIGVEYFFTWNVNNCVLWKTFKKDTPITERYVEFFDVLPAPIRNPDELENPRVKDQIKKFLVRFLERCTAILSGVEPMILLPLDEKFIRVWELAVMPLVVEALHTIHEGYDKQKSFRVQLDKWMRDEQGWTLSNDEEVIRENLERASRFSCYVLANKIVFYKALRRQFPQMKDLHIGAKIKTSEHLKELLDEAFRHATQITRDYETVFQTDFGDTLPLLNDLSIESWRALIEDTDKFDFTKINYEVIGQIFEGLLSTTERHKFGQHYTRSEVVDLINTFCIRDANAKVFDPSCGGGTFLVRAYQRKSDLGKGKLKHQDLVSQLFGTDISAYPVHLTTINLATRDLKEGANYPLVARHDFLRLHAGDKVFNVPNSETRQKPDHEGEIKELTPMPKVDVIVGNPPYVRQEKINDYYGKAYKKLLQDTAKKDAPDAELSGRSDILCYFFTHGATFLDEGGMMGLLTSSNWLDTAYGFRLQKFLLDQFEIIAIFESNCEPWFTGARVTTAATILRKQSDANKRNANNVKFVWLKKPIADFVTYSKSEDDRRATFEEIRRRIESLTEEEETDIWRVRVVNQAELYKAGCLAFDVSEDEEDSEEEETGQKPAPKQKRDDVQDAPASEQVALPGHEETRSEYTGYKWGIYLRAPEIFSKLLKRCGERLVPLGQIAEVKRGITSGCDAFFFPRDVTEEALKETPDEREFKDRYGIPRLDTEHIRIVHAGDGSQHLIEAEFLKPVVFNLMEIDSVKINVNSLKKKILFVSAPKEKIKSKYVLKYIKWGEYERFHERSTCASRDVWYDLNINQQSDCLWTKAQRYRHLSPFNDLSLICNCNLYVIDALEEENSETLCAALNSTITVLFKHQFGRTMGGDPLLKTEVSDVKMMLIPNPTHANAKVKKKLLKALESMRNRTTGHLVDVDLTDKENWTGELALEDRQQLDDAVLELLGISDADERFALRNELYTEITKLYRQIRVAEKKMQRHRSETARKGKQTAHSIAEEVWEELSEKPSFITPLNFIPSRTKTETITIPVGRAKIVKGHMFDPDGVQIGETFIPLGSPERSELVKALCSLELTGPVSIPVNNDVCEKALISYRFEVERLTDEFLSLASAYTADENMQQKVVNELWKKLRG